MRDASLSGSLMGAAFIAPLLTAATPTTGSLSDSVVAFLGTGAVLDLARDGGVPWLPWVALAVVGSGCALAVHLLGRAGRLHPRETATVAA
jgi:hypothetical protein